MVNAFFLNTFSRVYLKQNISFMVATVIFICLVGLCKVCDVYSLFMSEVSKMSSLHLLAPESFFVRHSHFALILSISPLSKQSYQSLAFKAKHGGSPPKNRAYINSAQFGSSPLTFDFHLFLPWLLLSL